MTSGLDGRTVLITGANRGLGAAFVEAALARGAATVLACARNTAAMPRFSDPARVVAVRMDMSDGASITAAAAEHPGVDLIVSNAALTRQAPVLADRDDEAQLRELMDVNVFGPLRLVRAFRGDLRRPGSGAVFVLSVAAVSLSRSSPMYSASKAAGLMLALALREEIGDAGGSVTTVMAGYIDTDMATGSDAPKASPRQVAERSLDGWLDGDPTVWPDRFAELVRAAVGEPFRRLLDTPREALAEVHATFRAGAEVG